MSKKNTQNPAAHQSNRKLFNAYFKAKKPDSLVSTLWVPFREIGFFLLPLPLLYLLFYYLVFENGGTENGMRGFYWLIFICVLAVDIAAFFLRKLYRGHKFNKYSAEEVPLFKGNVWHCPHCGNENNLLSPCPKCGIFPGFFKSDKAEIAKVKGSKKQRKLQKDYDDYVPQFK